MAEGSRHSAREHAQRAGDLLEYVPEWVHGMAAADQIALAQAHASAAIAMALTSSAEGEVRHG